MGVGNGVVIRFLADTGSAVRNIGKLEKATGRAVSTGDKARAAWRKAAPALAGIAAAGAAAFAVFATDGVQAAIGQEKANKRLGQTLKNLKLDQFTGQVLDTVDAMQRQYGVADDELLPGFERIVRVTEDVTKANAYMQAALDLSAAKGIPFSKAADIMAKAAGGQYGALRRVAPELGKIAETGAPAAEVLAGVNKQFRGAAAANAASTAGSMERISVAWDEIGESFGEGFLDGFAGPDVDTALQNMKDAEDDVRRVGDAMGTLGTNAIGWSSDFLNGLEAISLGIDTWSLDVTSKINGVLDLLGLISDEEGQRREDAEIALKKKRWWEAYDRVQGPGSIDTTGGGNFTGPSTPYFGTSDLYRTADPVREAQRTADADARAAARGAQTRKPR